MKTTIIVEGRPVSVQNTGARKRQWKERVAQEAQSVCNSPLRESNLRVVVTFYYNTLPDFDTDNILKPICDALRGIAYADDSQVEEATARRRDIGGSYRIKGANPELVLAVAAGQDFVCIEIEALPGGAQQL